LTFIILFIVIILFGITWNIYLIVIVLFLLKFLYLIYNIEHIMIFSILVFHFWGPIIVPSLKSFAINVFILFWWKSVVFSKPFQLLLAFFILFLVIVVLNIIWNIYFFCIVFFFQSMNLIENFIKSIFVCIFIVISF
jgi:hypothetical protein